MGFLVAVVFFIVYLSRLVACGRANIQANSFGCLFHPLIFLAFGENITDCLHWKILLSYSGKSFSDDNLVTKPKGI